MNSGEKNMPDFLIIGSMKSGTTSLYADLSRFPELYLPDDKEPQILVKYNLHDDIKAAYSRHFNGSKSNQLCGEASTAYTYSPKYTDIAEKAFNLCGQNLKLIMIMRDPIDRIFSHLRHDIAWKYIDAIDLNNVVLQDPKYVAVSDYSMQLEPWLKIFPISNLLCISFEEYKSDRLRVLKLVADFLDIEFVPKLFMKNNSVKNKSAELRYQGKFMSLIANSWLYKSLIRKNMNELVRSKFKNLLLKKSSLEEFNLDEETITELKARLSHVEERVREITQTDIRIYK